MNKQTSYIPTYQIDDEILLLVSSITEKIDRIDYHKENIDKPHLRKNTTIKSIYSSLAIEANSLSEDEVKNVIEGKNVIGKRNEIIEVKNAYNAYELMETINPFDMNELLKTHKIMMRDLANDAGSFRLTNEGVFARGVCIFVAPLPEFVFDLMHDLFDWLNRYKYKVHPLIMAAVFHYEFVFIHPFSDGNGRMARLWQTLILRNWKEEFSLIPIENQIEKYQKDYYQAIATSNKEGNSNSFIRFMLKMIDEVLSDVFNSINNSYGITSRYVKNLLEVMEYDIPYTSSELMKKLNLSSKENFRKNYIDPAISLGLLKMTIPDKPTSKNQRYVKV